MHNPRMWRLLARLRRALDSIGDSGRFWLSARVNRAWVKWASSQQWEE